VFITARDIIIHCRRGRRRNVDPRKKADPRARASVRRASGFVQIAISLKIIQALQRELATKAAVRPAPDIQLVSIPIAIPAMMATQTRNKRFLRSETTNYVTMGVVYQFHAESSAPKPFSK